MHILNFKSIHVPCDTVKIYIAKGITEFALQITNLKFGTLLIELFLRGIKFPNELDQIIDLI